MADDSSAGAGLKGPRFTWKFLKPKNYLSKNSLRAYWAEFTGMFFFLFISVGTAVGCYMTASRNILTMIAEIKKVSPQPADSDLVPGYLNYKHGGPDNIMILTVAFAFGICIMCFVYAVGHISGGHFNPAVTFATMLFGQINPIKAIVYIACQMSGAVLGALAIKGLTDEVWGSSIAYGTNGIAPGIDTSSAVILELLGAAALLFVIYGTAVDPKATHIVTHMAPVAIGFTVFLAHLFLIPPTGCGINPARSFGSAVISGNWTDQWVYWVGPMVGGPIGAMLHFFPLQWGDTDLGDARAVNIAGDDQEQKLEEQVEGVESMATDGGANANADEETGRAESA